MRRAAGFYAQVADVEPENLEVRKSLAGMLLAGGATEQAGQRIDEAYALAPEDPQVLALRATYLYGTGETEEGLSYANRTLESDPANIEANLVIATDLVVNGQSAEALTRIDALLATIPDNVPLNVFKLQVLLRDGDEISAERHLVSMVETFPETVEYRRVLGTLYMRSGNVEAAEGELRAIARMLPDDSEATLNVVRFVRAQRGDAAARQEITDQLAAQPPAETATALTFALSEIDILVGDIESARGVLEQLVATAAPDVADDARIRLARLDLAAGERSAARERVAVVLERDGDNVDALALRARLLIDDDRPEQAVLTLRQALSLEPQNVDLLLLEAEAQQRNGNLTLASERLGAAARASDFRPDVALRYAEFLIGRQNQPASAESVLGEAIRRNPDNVTLLTALAELRLRQEDYAGAESIARQLRPLQGGDTVADRVLAETLARQGRVEESIGMLESIVAENEGSGSALARLVAGHVQAGNVPAAVALLDERIAAEPEDIRALILRAELHLLAGDAPAAETILRDIVDIAPQDQTSHAVLARFLLATGRTDDAIAQARTGVAETTSNGVLRLFLASLYEMRGEYDAAIEQYEGLYEQQPNSLVAANNLASLIAEFREDDPEAIDRASRIARRLRGSSVPHFQDTYGWIAFLANDLATALPNLEAAAQGLPNNALVRYHYGRALLASGEVERGQAELEAALAIDPAFSKAASAQRAIEQSRVVGQ